MGEAAVISPEGGLLMDAGHSVLGIVNSFTTNEPTWPAQKCPRRRSID